MGNDTIRRARRPRRSPGEPSGTGTRSRRPTALVLVLALVAGVTLVGGAGPAGAALPMGTMASFPLGPGLEDARDLTTGPDGNLWFVSATSDAIGRITLDGVVSTFTHPDVRDPVDLAAGPDGNVWFVATNWAAGERGTIGRVTPGGAFTLFPSPNVYRPTSIVAGPDGRLWFTDASTRHYQDTGQVGAITTDGAFPLSFPYSRGFRPDQIVFATDGRPWLSGGGQIAFTDRNLVFIGMVQRLGGLFGSDLVPGHDGSMWLRGTSVWPPGPAGIIHLPWASAQELDRFAPDVHDPADLVAGPRGGVWFADPAGAIGHVAGDGSVTTSPVPGSSPRSLTVGPDGSVWFLSGESTIGRVRADGHVDTFASPGTVASPMVVGPDANLWFVDGSSSIGRIVTAPEAGAPIFVDAVAGKRQATVSWGAPLSPLGPVTGYEVVASPGGAGCATVGATSCIVADLTPGTRYSFAVRALGPGGPGPAVTSRSVVPWSGSGYHAVPPTRVLDSRLPTLGFAGPVTASKPRRLQVAGLRPPADVPTSATAVVMNVTVTDSTAPSYLTVYPAGTSKPNASNLNFGTNQVIANLVTVRVGTGGAVDISTAVGSTHVVADVIGYYDDGAGAGGLFVPVSPVRLLDSRLAEPWGEPLEAGQPRWLELRSAWSPTISVPWTATAVVVNVTVTNADSQSYASVYPETSARAGISTLNFLPGQTIANLTVVDISATDDIDIWFANAIGSVDVIVDLVGYLDPTAGSRFHAIDPTRVLDSRTGAGLAGPQGPGQVRPLAVAGAPGSNVPVGATGVVANLTVADATAESYASIFPSARSRPDPFSNLNFGINQVIPNLTVVGLEPDGTAALYNHLGRTQVIADLVGWFGPY